MIYVLLIAILLTGCAQVVKQPSKAITVYIFNDKTQLWDRAREETLKNATCEKLRMYRVGE